MSLKAPQSKKPPWTVAQFSAAVGGRRRYRPPGAVAERVEPFHRRERLQI